MQSLTDSPQRSRYENSKPAAPFRADYPSSRSPPMSAQKAKQNVELPEWTTFCLSPSRWLVRAICLTSTPPILANHGVFACRFADGLDSSKNYLPIKIHSLDLSLLSLGCFSLGHCHSAICCSILLASLFVPSHHLPHILLSRIYTLSYGIYPDNTNNSVTQCACCIHRYSLIPTMYFTYVNAVTKPQFGFVWAPYICWCNACRGLRADIGVFHQG